VVAVISGNRRRIYRNSSSVRVCAFALLALTGCNDWDAKAPPESRQEHVDLVLPDSYAQMTIAVSAKEFETSLLEAYATEPFDRGKSNELDAKLLVKKRTLVRKPETYVVTPPRAAGCVTKEIVKSCPKQIAQNMTEKCWHKFLSKPVECLKAIWVEQYLPCNEAYQSCWPEVKQVIASRLVSALETRDKLIPTSTWINHELFLRGLYLEAYGSGLNFRADMELAIAIDLKTGILEVSETIEGALQCRSTFRVTGKADTVIDNALQMDVSIENLKIDKEKVCTPSAVEIADAALSAPANVLTAPLERIILTEIQRKLNKKIGGELAGNLDFRNLLNRFSTDLSKSLQLGSGVWLLLNPRALAMSQMYSAAVGNESALSVDLAVIAQPVVYLLRKTPTSRSISNPPITVVDSLADGLSLGAASRHSLVSADNLLLKEIRKFLKTKQPNAPLTVAAAHLYQSGQQFVIRLTLLRETDGKLLGNAYLWARPYVDELHQEVRLQDVRFDSDTQRVLNKVAAWLLSSKLEQSIQQTIAFGYGGLLEYFQTGFDDFKAESGSTILSGDLKSIEVKSIWIADNAINISAIAEGSMTLAIKRNGIPAGPEAILQ
jgi:hypothetical protein